MRFLASLLFLGILLAIPAAAQQRPSNQPTGFFHPQVARDADRYEAYLKSGWTPSAAKSPATSEPRAIVGFDPIRAAPRGNRQRGRARALNAENWLGLARALLAIKPDPPRLERYDLPVNASPAPSAPTRSRQDTGRQGARPRSSCRCAAAAFLLAPGDRCAEGQPRTRRGSASARGLRQAARRARLPHDRLQDRQRCGAAARLPPVLRETCPARRRTSRSSSPSTARTRRTVVAGRQQLCIDGLTSTASATRSRSAPACRPTSARR